MASKKKDRSAEREERVARDKMLTDAKKRENIIKWATIGCIALIFVVMVGILIYNGKKKEDVLATPITFSESPHTILPFVDPSVTGDPQPSASESATPVAVVTIVEFADIQCPSCKNYHSTVREFTKNNPNVKYVFKHFPLTMHQHARRAALVAEAAGAQGKFFEMLDILYANQDAWSAEDDPTQTFLGYAEELGLDTAQFTRDLENEEFAKRIEDNINEGIAAGVNGTPTFFVNGMALSGLPANNVAAFQAIVDAQLSQ